MMRQENPPKEHAVGGKRGVWKEEAEQARQNPGVWFMFREWPDPTQKQKASARAYAVNIRQGKVAAFRPGGAFSAVSRTIETEEKGKTTTLVKVYVMYLGNLDDAKKARKS